VWRGRRVRRDVDGRELVYAACIGGPQAPTWETWHDLPRLAAAASCYSRARGASSDGL
jgi:hypothetical protein